MTKKALALFSGVVLLAAVSAPAFATDPPAAPAAPAAAVAPKPKPVPVKDLKEGDPIPDFSMTMLSGKVVQSKELAAKNKTMILTFIQTACSACKGEIVALNKMAKDSDKVYVLPVAVDMRSGKEFLDTYKSENAISFDFGLDPKFAVPRLFNVSFTPASVLIQNGIVTKIYRGYDDEIREELAKVFK